MQRLPPLSWNCNSHRAPQWERKWVWGIVHDINPPKHYSSRSNTDRQTQSKSTIYLLKGKLNQQSLWLLSTLIWWWLSWMSPSSFLSGDFMGPLPAILDSHYCAVVWVPLFCHPHFRYSEQNTSFLFTKPGNWMPHRHQTVQLSKRADRKGCGGGSIWGCLNGKVRGIGKQRDREKCKVREGVFLPEPKKIISTSIWK